MDRFVYHLYGNGSPLFYNIHVTKDGSHIPLCYKSRDRANLELGDTKGTRNKGAYRIVVKRKKGERHE